MTLLIISGTPGTGKTTLAHKLALKLNFTYLKLQPLIKKNSSGYDYKKDCNIVDLKKLNQEIIKIIKQKKQNLIIASHLSHHLPKKYVNLCIITQCSDLKKLKRRLKQRKYSPKKIEENLQCEAFDLCYQKAQELGHQLITLDTSQRIPYQKLINSIKSKLNLK